MMNRSVLHMTVPVLGLLEPQGSIISVVLRAVVDFYIVEDGLACPQHIIFLHEVTGDELTAPSINVFSLQLDVPVQEEHFSSHVYSLEVTCSRVEVSPMVVSEVSVKNHMSSGAVIGNDYSEIGLIISYGGGSKSYHISSNPVKPSSNISIVHSSLDRVKHSRLVVGPGNSMHFYSAGVYEDFVSSLNGAFKGYVLIFLGSMECDDSIEEERIRIVSNDEFSSSDKDVVGLQVEIQLIQEGETPIDLQLPQDRSVFIKNHVPPRLNDHVLAFHWLHPTWPCSVITPVSFSILYHHFLNGWHAHINAPDTDHCDRVPKMILTIDDCMDLSCFSVV
mmetsp:Transcript_29268/g.28417  ORF Transcript_29268/g.28417 Transcript_29268/m.28417 type:complete len:334 (-) Transcript_29268:1118-2119(-)